MKKIYFLLFTIASTIGLFAQTNAFNGSDFETWTDFTGNLNSYGLKSYATQGSGQGYGGTNSLNITANTSGNDYVFTALPPSSIPSSVTAITFWVKGTSPSKSLSINLYKTDGSYYKFNVEDLTTDKTIIPSGSNQYIGTIDTGGNWVKVTLDLSGITDYATAASDNFFALKIGKQSDYSIDLDDFQFQTPLGTVDLNPKSTKLITTVDASKTLMLKGVNAKAVQIYDMNGKAVKAAKGNQVSVASLPAGVYVVRVMDENGKVTTSKFIKK